MVPLSVSFVEPWGSKIEAILELSCLDSSPLSDPVNFIGAAADFNLINRRFQEGTMIWDEPWTQIALQKGGTTIPPPRSPLPKGQEFRCVRCTSLPLQEWADLVGTRWTTEELALRLEDAWIPCLYDKGALVATCVLRPRSDYWILETLRARSGYGRTLIRAVIPWIYDTAGGPFTMAYTWELSLVGLMGAWWRGWLGSATEIQYGWSWTAEEGTCGFCPQGWEPLGPRLALPALFQDGSSSAIVSDSGLGDGWGYVTMIRGSPDWSAIAKKGGWRFLWYRGANGPAGFRWSGEFVVVGLLNQQGPVGPLEWCTAEIA